MRTAAANDEAPFCFSRAVRAVRSAAEASVTAPAPRSGAAGSSCTSQAQLHGLQLPGCRAPAQHCTFLRFRCSSDAQWLAC